MKSIIEKKIFKRKYTKRLLALVIIFILSIFALKHLEKQHPLPKDKQTMEDIQKPVKKEVQVIEEPEKTLTVAQKKQRFKDLLVPAVDNAYAKLDTQYKEIKKLMNKNAKHHKVLALKEEYDAKSNHDLLLKLKPHPKSVTLAQAAIESAWGTSRFFTKANNVFGVWSFNKHEPRIAAGETRGEKTIFLKKYNTIEESVLDYYKILSKAGAYHQFRVQNYKEPNPYLLVKHLDRYSEKRAEYGKILSSVIGYNKFAKYDEKFYPRPPKPKKPKVEEKPKKVEETKVSTEVKELDSNETKTTTNEVKDLNTTENKVEKTNDNNVSNIDTNTSSKQ